VAPGARNRMVAMTMSKRQCPICGGNAIVKGKLVGSFGFMQRRWSGPDINVKCSKCGYYFILGSAEAAVFLLFIVLMFVAPIMVFIFKSIYVFAFAFISVFLIPWLSMRWFVKSSYFDKYISRMIIKKATKMVQEGKKHNKWSGDQIADLDKIRIYDQTDSWMTRYK
jgi:hypothetical protein